MTKGYNIFPKVEMTKGYKIFPKVEMTKGYKISLNKEMTKGYKISLNKEMTKGLNENKQFSLSMRKSYIINYGKISINFGTLQKRLTVVSGMELRYFPETNIQL